MIIFISFILGVLVGALSVIGWAAYNYYRAWKEAYDEGWDMPS